MQKGKWHAVAKIHLNFPKELTSDMAVAKESDDFIVAYWACKQSFDNRLVNAEKMMKAVSIKIGSVTHSINVPVCSNTKKLNTGDEIVVYRNQADHDDDCDCEEPPPKRIKASSKGVKGGKAKGKGKSRK